MCFIKCLTGETPCSLHPFFKGLAAVTLIITIIALVSLACPPFGIYLMGAHFTTTIGLYAALAAGGISCLSAMIAMGMAYFSK